MTQAAVPRTQRILVPPTAAAPEIGRWLAALHDARQRTLRAVEGISTAALDWTPPLGGNAIGTLLYHIAAIELDYLASDVLGGGIDPAIWEHFPWDVRDESGRLTVVRGVSLADHLARLERVRGLLDATFAAMSVEEFRRVRPVEDYDATPEYTLHHLLQHEAEHRAEIRQWRAEAERSDVL